MDGQRLVPSHVPGSCMCPRASTALIGAARRSVRPAKPSWMPSARSPDRSNASQAPAITAFIPGASPPLVRMPIVIVRRPVGPCALLRYIDSNRCGQDRSLSNVLDSGRRCDYYRANSAIHRGRESIVNAQFRRHGAGDRGGGAMERSSPRVAGHARARVTTRRGAGRWRRPTPVGSEHDAG